MNSPVDWPAVLEASVQTVFCRSWGLAAEAVSEGALGQGVTAVMPLRVGSQQLQAVLTLDKPLADLVAQRLGAAPSQASEHAGEATAECLNLLAGRLAGHVGPMTDLLLGIPSVRVPARSGQDRKSTRLNSSH